MTYVSLGWDMAVDKLAAANWEDVFPYDPKVRLQAERT